MNNLRRLNYFVKNCTGSPSDMEFKNPAPTVDIIIELENRGLVLIERKNPPFGWAIPGGFVDYGESLEKAALREAQEETGLKVTLVRQFFTYSEPERDPRQHTVSTVYIARATGQPVAASDAKSCKVFSLDELPDEMAFDHRMILEDYLRYLKEGDLEFLLNRQPDSLQ